MRRVAATAILAGAFLAAVVPGSGAAATPSTGVWALGDDFDAKVRVHNALAYVESCFANELDYRRCDSPTELGAAPDVAFGRGLGKARVEATRRTVRITVRSRSGNVFRAAYGAGSRRVRKACTRAGRAGCPRSGRWREPGDSAGGAYSALAREYDDAAQANALTLAALVDECGSRTGEFVQCDTFSELGAPSTVTVGGGDGQVNVVSATVGTYTVAARSRSGNVFSLARNADGGVARTCVRPGHAGCPASGVW
jgi:hypothetical protein